MPSRLALIGPWIISVASLALMVVLLVRVDDLSSNSDAATGGAVQGLAAQLDRIEADLQTDAFGGQLGGGTVADRVVGLQRSVDDLSATVSAAGSTDSLELDVQTLQRGIDDVRSTVGQICDQTPGCFSP